MKLFKDFGVTALLGTVVLVGSFEIMTIALIKGLIDAKDIMLVISAWGGAVVGSYFAIKSIKTERDK